MLKLQRKTNNTQQSPMWNQVRPIKLVPLEEDRHCVLYICPGDFAEQCRLKNTGSLGGTDEAFSGCCPRTMCSEVTKQECWLL